ncbi:MAG: ABC transporter permease subunit [Phycisphaeraceae bacterium]|nr:ABC transporter permease subunit [Phycisphaeraceae bacterium]
MSRVWRQLKAVANPFALAFGPIFQKEVRTAGRRRATYILRSLCCLGLLLLLIGVFLVRRAETGVQGAVASLQSMQQMAPAMTLAVGWFFLAVMTVVPPILAGGSLCDERRARTLDVLMTTPMTAGQIVCGKLTSRIVQIIVLALLVAPGLLAVRIFGGLSAEVIGAVTALAISTAVLGAALAVLFSMRQKRATLAAFFALLTLLLLQGAPSVIEGMRFFHARDLFSDAAFRSNILATCSPATMLIIHNAVSAGRDLPHLILETRAASQPPGGGPTIPAAVLDLGPTWAINAVYNLSLAALITLYTTVILRRAMRATSSREALLGATARAPAQKSAEPKESAEPESAGERYARRDRTVGGNPVLWREVRQPTFGSRLIFRIVLVLAVLALGALYALAGLGNPDLHAVLAYIGIAAVMLQAVFLTSGPFAGEREARTWDVLLTTTLSPRQILTGKLLGTLRSFWFIPAVVITDWVIASAFGYIHPFGVLLIALIMIAPGILLASTGLLFSLRFRRPVTAGALNVAVAACLWGFVWFLPLALPAIVRAILYLPGVLGLVNVDLTVDRFLDNHYLNFIDAIFALNPFALAHATALPCLHEATPGGIAKAPFESRLITHELTLDQALAVVAACAAFYLFAAAATVALARWKFKAWSGRSS